MNQYSFKEDSNSMTTVIKSLKNNSNLNNWERSFIENLSNRFAGGAIISAKQLKILSDLWEKY